MVLHSKKLESPPPKDALCFVPNLVLIGLVVLDKIMKSFQYNYTISLLAPVKKKRDPSFEQVLKDVLCLWLMLA